VPLGRDCPLYNKKGRWQAEAWLKPAILYPNLRSRAGSEAKSALSAVRVAAKHFLRMAFSSFLNPYLVKWRARDADRNNAWARRAINLLVDYVIGTGLKPMVSLTDITLRGRVNKLWNAWSDGALKVDYRKSGGSGRDCSSNTAGI
jgi:hypothetical protein